MTTVRSMPVGIFADPDSGVMIRFEDNRERRISYRERTVLVQALRNDAGAPGLPEAVRVPLHELQADVDYLIGRVAADGSCSGMIAASIKAKLSAIEAAISQDKRHD